MSVVTSSKPKIRNYSFVDSKRIPLDKMTEVNGVKIPSLPGSCYHAVICGLAQYKDAFVPWGKITELVEKYMRQYGGASSWNKFRDKKGVKTYQQRIKDNAHTLTRTGRDCYGYRLHELGMAIYFFKDGVMLLTGGEFEKKGDSYSVTFPDGRGLQVRYRGTTMTSKEYKRFFEEGFIDASARILDANAIRAFRRKAASSNNGQSQSRKVPHAQLIKVNVTLNEDFDQETAARLEAIGLMVAEAAENELTGQISSDKLTELEADDDVLGIEFGGTH